VVASPMRASISRSSSSSGLISMSV
jgi:hypothetical protein